MIATKLNSLNSTCLVLLAARKFPHTFCTNRAHIYTTAALLPLSSSRLRPHSAISFARAHMSGIGSSSETELTPPPDINSPVAALVDDFVGAQVIKRALSEDDTANAPKPKGKRPKRVAARAKAQSNNIASADSPTSSFHEDNALEADTGEDDPIETPPKAKKRGKKVDTKDDKPKKERKPTPKKSRLAAKDEPEYDSEGNEIVKKKRKPKVYPKIEYDIPDVERKTTTFKGRLGYACLNTVLRSTKPDSIFCSRTCRISSIEEEGLELPKGLAMMNVKDLVKMIEWNEQNNIRFMRMSSEMFPFASHAKYGYDLSFADAELKEAGALARKYGHRLTMHPGQFTQLGSPKKNVIDASIRELEYQCEIMDRMGIDQDGVMIIHMGGTYGDKEASLARFKENYTARVSEAIKKRLVLENDEICYNVDDLMPICNELNIPLIFDYHHDWIYPSAEPPGVLMPKIAETWSRKGIRMKQHLSEPRPGAESVMERRAHADRCQALPPDLPDDVDLMIEAKDKEQAVFELYRIYGLEEVIHDSLRPADPNPSMQTKGRKSNLKKKVKATGEVDLDGLPLELSDVEKEGDGELGDEAVPEANMADSEEIIRKTKSKAKKTKKGGKAGALAENVNGQFDEAPEDVKLEGDLEELQDGASGEKIQDAGKGKKRKAAGSRKKDGEAAPTEDVMGNFTKPVPKKRVR